MEAFKMKKLKVGINGMGRIGKNLCRVITQDLQDYFDIVAANDLVPAEMVVKSFRRDSTHGRFPVEVKLLADNEIQLGPNRVRMFAEKDAIMLQTVNAKNALEAKIYNVKNMVSDSELSDFSQAVTSKVN